MFRVSARTVLELGSELISRDIIAFYELIKNAFDAHSKSGADIRFVIALRRNEYLRIRKRALGLAEMPSAPGQKERRAELFDEIKEHAVAALDPSSGKSVVEAITGKLRSPVTIERFITALDDAYTRYNTIEIADSGTGMSAEELTEHYLTIGTPSRKRSVAAAIVAKEAKPPYLGEKGIGRLSAMRLGNSLRLETARETDSHLNVLDIDWRLFDNLDAMIEDIPIASSRGARKPSSDWCGTRLTIGDLNGDWTEKQLRELAELEFSRLTDPFIDRKQRPRVALFWNGTRIAIPSMDRTLIEHAHASLIGKYVLRDGRPELQVQMDAFDLGDFEHPHETDSMLLTEPDLESLLTGTEHEIPSSALESVGPFEFEIYWYNRKHLTGIDKIGNQKAVRDLQRRWSGILLFRDGFRVFPYGEDEDDWLGLDRKALGRSGYVLNKNQVVGRVQITRTGNPGLVDQTNREGLRSTPEQRVLIATLGYLMRDMLWEFFTEVKRRYRTMPIELGDVKARVRSLETRARSAIAKVRALVPKEEREVIVELQSALSEFHELSTQAQERIEEVEAEGRQLVHMAGIGLMVEVVAHELARASESALASLERLRGKEFPADVKARLETLRAEMKTVSKRLRVLDELSVPGRQRAEVFDLRELLNDLSDGHQGQFARHSIGIDIRMPKGALRVKLVKGMVVQILENLVSNAVYWTTLRARNDSRYKPMINITVEADPLVIRFSDNGRGIAPDHRDRIFRPFWSLKEKGKRRGLGLFIARENAGQLGGTLQLSNVRNSDFGRLNEFILELPDSARVK